MDKLSSLLSSGNETEWSIFFLLPEPGQICAVLGGPTSLQVTAAGAQAPGAGHASVLSGPGCTMESLTIYFLHTTRLLLP